MKELIKQAKQGDAEAQFLLGLTYYNGDVLENSPEKAFKWWMKVAKQEYVFALPYFKAYFTLTVLVAVQDPNALLEPLVTIART